VHKMLEGVTRHSRVSSVCAAMIYRSKIQHSTDEGTVKVERNLNEHYLVSELALAPKSGSLTIHMTATESQS